VTLFHEALPYPIDQRRVTAAEEREMVSFAVDRLTTGIGVCRGLASERGRAWPEHVLPYGRYVSTLLGQRFELIDAVPVLGTCRVDETEAAMRPKPHASLSLQHLQYRVRVL
jgi:hypothetical protein